MAILGNNDLGGVLVCFGVVKSIVVVEVLDLVYCGAHVFGFNLLREEVILALIGLVLIQLVILSSKLLGVIGFLQTGTAFLRQVFDDSYLVLAVGNRVKHRACG